MVWTLHGNYLLGIQSNEIVIPTNFTDEYLVIKTTPVGTVKPTWRYFGELEQIANLINIGETRLNLQKLKLSTTRIKFDNSIPYELKFIAYHWLPDISIDIYRDI